MHEVFLAVTLPAHDEPEITVWFSFPTAYAAAAAAAADRGLIEVAVPLGDRAMRRWTDTHSSGDQVIVYAAPYEQET